MNYQVNYEEVACRDYDFARQEMGHNDALQYVVNLHADFWNMTSQEMKSWLRRIVRNRKA